MATQKRQIGQYLRRFRDNFNLKQNKVAEAIGVTPQQYLKYETDQISPSVAVVINLADAYNVSTDYLLGLSDAPNPTGYDEDEVRKSIAFRRSWLEAQRTKDAAQRAQAEFENQVKLLTQ